jgi:hypothetical protein
MRFNEFKSIIKEAADTQSITVHFTDGTIKAITDIPMTVFNSSNFEQSLRDKMNRNFPNKEYSRFTVSVDFEPTADEKQQMENVNNLYDLIRREITKLFDADGANTPFPDNISFSYRVGDSNNSIPDVKEAFDITTYNNTRDPKSDNYGVIHEEGWPISLGDFDDLKQKIIDKLEAGDVIALGSPPSEAQKAGEPLRITVAPNSFQYKRELDMYNGGSE